MPVELLDTTAKALNQEMPLARLKLVMMEEPGMSNRGGAIFQRIEARVAGDETALRYAEIATERGLSEAAVKMAMQRMRSVQGCVTTLQSGRFP